jgi:hypothetical protein
MQKPIRSDARSNLPSQNFYCDRARMFAIVCKKYCRHPPAPDLTLDNETIAQNIRQLAGDVIEQKSEALRRRTIDERIAKGTLVENALQI